MSWAVSRSIIRYFVNNTRNIHSNVPCCHFQSAIGLKLLYPKSDLDISKKIEPPNSDGLNFSGFIPMDKLKITYSRSSGPGGQNVNKVNTKVDLRFHLNDAAWLPQPLKEKMLEKYKTSINSEGYFVVRSDKTRSQQLNVAHALDKLRIMIREAAYVPPVLPAEVVEKNRRRHEASARERLRQKRMRSVTKADRQGPQVDL